MYSCAKYLCYKRCSSFYIVIIFPTTFSITVIRGLIALLLSFFLVISVPNIVDVYLRLKPSSVKYNIASNYRKMFH